VTQEWNQQLLEQVAQKFDKYKIVHVDLASARTNEQKDYCGDFLTAINASDSQANIDVRLNQTKNDPINLVLNTSINTIFEKFFVTNTAQAAAWVELFIGINCKLERMISASTGGGGGGTEYADGAARGSAIGALAMGDDGANIQSVAVDSSGHLQVDVLSGGGGGGTRTISKIWDSEQTIINAAAVTTGTLSSAVDLKTNGYEAATITISATFSTTDDLDIEVLNSNDGSAYDDLTYEIFSIRMPHTDSATKQISFIIKDLPQFKLNVKRSGSTDTITVTAKAMPWRYQSA
jgi:hypothetical protein